MLLKLDIVKLLTLCYLLTAAQATSTSTTSNETRAHHHHHRRHHRHSHRHIVFTNSSPAADDEADTHDDVADSMPQASTTTGKSPAAIDKSFENVTVKVGQQATLPCFVAGSSSYKVIWSKDGDILSLGSTKINSDQRLNIQHRYVSEWHLMIDNVVTDDEGEYICKTNGHFYKTIYLQVLSKLTFKLLALSMLTVNAHSQQQVEYFFLANSAADY